jgi:hypothetical protein
MKKNLKEAIITNKKSLSRMLLRVKKKVRNKKGSRKS